LIPEADKIDIAALLFTKCNFNNEELKLHFLIQIIQVSDFTNMQILINKQGKFTFQKKNSSHADQWSMLHRYQSPDLMPLARSAMRGWGQITRRFLCSLI